VTIDGQLVHGDRDSAKAPPRVFSGGSNPEDNIALMPVNHTAQALSQQNVIT